MPLSSGAEAFLQEDKKVQEIIVRIATFSKHFNNCSLCWKTLDSSKGTSYHLSFKQEALCWSQFIWPIFNETKH